MRERQRLKCLLGHKDISQIIYSYIRENMQMYTFSFLHVQHNGIRLMIVLYGYDTWSLTLREERRLRC